MSIFQNINHRLYPRPRDLQCHGLLPWNTYQAKNRFPWSRSQVRSQGLEFDPQNPLVKNMDEVTWLAVVIQVLGRQRQAHPLNSQTCQPQLLVIHRSTRDTVSKKTTTNDDNGDDARGRTMEAVLWLPPLTHTCTLTQACLHTQPQLFSCMLEGLCECRGANKKGLSKGLETRKKKVCDEAFPSLGNWERHVFFVKNVMSWLFFHEQTGWE